MRFFFNLVLVFLLVFFAYNGYLWWKSRHSNIVLDIINVKAAVKKVERNYGAEVDAICSELELPAHYFKALIILESSANKQPKSRYEAHVFARLQAVQQGKLESYNYLKKADLEKFTNQQLVELATSWGPLQVMGYHTLAMNIPLAELKNEKALRHSIRWCKDNYGTYLKNADYKNAFHIHNTGKPLPWLEAPKTHDPYYIFKGLQYIDALKKPIEQQAFSPEAFSVSF
jgi:hypothetical protein